MALPADAKSGGVSSTRPVEPKPRRRIKNPKIKTIERVKNLLLKKIFIIILQVIYIL